MKYIYTLLLLISLVLFGSCKSRCSDCNATNFDSKAKSDKKCDYKNENITGVYHIEDIKKTFGEISLISTNIYNIKLEHGGCNPDGLVISRFGNETNNQTKASLAVEIDIIGDSIFIPYQIINGDQDPGYTEGDFEILESKGYFKGDSIFFEINEPESDGSENYRFCRGKKI